MQVEVNFRQLVTVVMLGRVAAGSVVAACFWKHAEKQRFGSSGCSFYALLYKL